MKNNTFIIPIFLPQAGCRNQCVFCNQRVITGQSAKIPSKDQVISQINQYLGYSTKKRDIRQISFYGGNFLGLKKDQIISFLEVASIFVNNFKVQSIRFSTRPDTINDSSLDLIKKYPIKTIEIGAQSMDDNVLLCSKRGHTTIDTINAVKLIKSRGFEAGIQIMIGLPGETKNSDIITCEEIALLKPAFIRIYPTVILKGSPLEKLFEKSRYQPLSIESAVTRTKKIFLFFKKKNISVIRMGLQSSESLDNNYITGPYHPAFGHLVFSEIFLDRCIKLLLNYHEKRVTFLVHSKNISKIRGIKNRNIEVLKKEFNLRSISVYHDDSLNESEILLSKTL